jgi:hypothetical protein
LSSQDSNRKLIEVSVKVLMNLNLKIKIRIKIRIKIPLRQEVIPRLIQGVLLHLRTVQLHLPLLHQVVCVMPFKVELLVVCGKDVKTCGHKLQQVMNSLLLN